MSIVGQEHRMRTSMAGVGSRPGLGWFVLAGCAVVLNSPAALASDAIPSPLVVVGYAGDPGEITVAGVRTALDPVLYASAKASQNLRFDGFALGKGLAVDLDLEQFDVMSPDGVLIVAGEQGEVATPRPDMVMLRGTIAGDPTSLVMMTLSPLGTNGFIRSDLGTFMIASDDNGGAYVYNTRDAGEVAISIPPCQGALQVPGQGGAAAARGAGQAGPVRPLATLDDAIRVPGVPMHAAGSGVGGRPGGFEAVSCRTIRVAVDTDWEYRSISRFTSDAAAQTYAMTLWGAVSEIYRRETNVSLSVPYLRIWSSNTDPYPDGSAIGDRLGQFLNHWRATKSGVSRDIAHLLSATGGGGVAYLTVLCNNTWGYGADGSLAGTFPQPIRDHQSQNWDLMVTAHELGHNFSAPHTHSMTPVADGCGNGDCSAAYGGTIMSYCHTCSGGMSNIVLEFHERTLSEAILPYLAGSAASCGASLVEASITTQPPVFHTARAGTKTQFQVVGAGQDIAYAWTFNTKTLVDGPTGTGSVISGATTATLTVSNLSTKDIGTYKAIVSNSCSSVTSNNASLSVRCASDMDEDGTVELADFFAFFNCFDQSDLCADMNGDDSIDLIDFFAFLNAFDKEC
jgi:hypothetical protein